jgi:hypothetical protein
MAVLVVNAVVTAFCARQGKAFWREQVAGWKGSGLNQLELRRDRGLSSFAFGKWKVQLEERFCRRVLRSNP